MQLCLFVVIRLFFTHNNRWRAANFDLCSAFWQLSSEGSLARHTYCDIGHPFIMVISKDLWQGTCCRVLGSGAVTTCFNDMYVGTGDRTQISRMRDKRSSTEPPRRCVPDLGGMLKVNWCMRFWVVRWN